MKNKKMISGLLLFTITSYMTIPVFAASKSETVYSNLDSNGKAYKTIVSTQLTNEDKSDEITDISNLLNIENTNGDETFKKEGNQIVWDSNGNNIYYKGESDKQLPVECKITYELNGEEISAEELKGKIILVTGGAGFIGYHLSKQLLEYDCTVIGYDLSLIHISEPTRPY